MRLLIAGAAVLAVVAFASPSYAQDDAPAPTPAAKPKPGTQAYCQSLKSASARNTCLKKVTASKAAPAPTRAAKAKAKKAPTTTAAPKQPDSAQLPPAAAPAATAPAGTVAVPPLPQKTI